MGREPSIHITARNMVRIFCDVMNEVLEIGGGTTTPMPAFNKLDKDEQKAYIELELRILHKAKQYSLIRRSVLVDSAKLAKSTNKLLLASRSDAAMFANCLVLIRKQQRHVGIALVKPGSKDWPMVKEVTSLAFQFCDDFGLTKEEGFKEYIKIALGKMKKFALAKFNSIHPSICLEYQALRNIRMDNHPEATREACLIYQGKVGEKTGIPLNYDQYPEKYESFIKVVDEAKKFGIHVEVYISAQFAAFEWTNGIPDPLQLFGDKSDIRVNKYLIENNIKAVQTTPTIDWKKVKKAKHEGNSNK